MKWMQRPKEMSLRRRLRRQQRRRHQQAKRNAWLEELYDGWVLGSSHRGSSDLRRGADNDVAVLM